jgi:hypothetical protein
VGDRISIRAQADLLRNVLSGQNLVIRDPLLEVSRFRPGTEDTYVIDNLDLSRTKFDTGGLFREIASGTDRDGQEVPQFQLTRVWGDVLLPFGRLRFGRMPVRFGMGLVFNDGLGLDDDYGDTFDRFMFSTKIGPVVPAVGYDRMAEGDITSGWTDVHQVFANVGYTGDPVSAAANFAMRLQDSTDARVFILNGWLKALYKGFSVEAEAAIFQGSTVQVDGDAVDALEDAGYPTGQGGGKVAINAYLAALRAGFATDTWTVGLEGGFSSPAEGNPDHEFSLTAAERIAREREHLDADPDNPDRRQDFLDTVLANQAAFGKHMATFPFDPDYHVDLLLWRSILGGSVVNGAYAKGFFTANPFDWLGVRLDIITSWINSPGPARKGGDASTDLGWEFDPSVTFSVAKHFHLDVQFGYLMLGDYFRDVYKDAASPYTVQANFTIDF